MEREKNNWKVQVVQINPNRRYTIKETPYQIVAVGVCDDWNTEYETREQWAVVVCP